MEPSTRQQVKTIVEQLGDRFPENAKKAASKAIIDMIELGFSTEEVLNMTPKMLNQLYRYAYKIFQGGKYKEAFGCFYFLRELDPSSYRYNFCVAACHQYLKQYEEAAACYILCSALSPDNPTPHFHLYECFMQLNQPLSALNALAGTIFLAGQSPHYAVLQARAQLEYESLEQQLRTKKIIKDVDKKA